LKILHVEVGGTYGGSTRALELYLANTKRPEFVHDLLFYYPTPRTEQLSQHVRKMWTLYPEAPAWMTSAPEHRPSVRRRAARSESLKSLRNWIRLVRQFPEARRLAKLMRDGGYDLIHVNNTFTYQPVTMLAASLARVPVVAHVRNPVQPDAYTRFLARRGRCLVAVAEVHAENLRKMDSSLRAVTCHDPVASVSADREASDALRKSLVGDGCFLVGSVGRLDAQKGYEFLIRAAAQVVARVPNVRFAIAGDGALRGELQALIDNLGLREHFRLLGFRSDTADFIGALDVFALSSLWEGLPLTLLDAMRIGKPAVTTAVGGVPEVIQNGVNGLLVPPKDPDALAERITELLRDAELRSRIGMAAPSAIRSFCDLRARAEDLDSIFLSALGRPGSEIWSEPVHPYDRATVSSGS